MKQEVYKGFTFIVAVAGILATLLLANANFSYAASDKAKSSAVVKKSAADQTESRIIMLQSALKITDAQELLWNSLTLVMRENAKEMDSLSKDRAEKMNTMNAVERMKFHSQITDTQSGQLKKFIPPFEALYTSMSEEQKNISDSIFRTGKHGKKKMM